MLIPVVVNVRGAGSLEHGHVVVVHEVSKTLLLQQLVSTVVALIEASATHRIINVRLIVLLIVLEGVKRAEKLLV